MEAAFDEFLKYKTRVPVCGAVLLADDWKSVRIEEQWDAAQPAGHDAKGVQKADCDLHHRSSPLTAASAC